MLVSIVQTILLNHQRHVSRVERSGNNMRIIIIITVLLAATTAQAQQQITPSQMAIQIDNAVNGLASSVEVLQTQLKQSQARVKELETKYEPKEPTNAQHN
jgi:hypothetical protein